MCKDQCLVAVHRRVFDGRLRVLPQKVQDTPAQALRAYLSVDLPDDAKRWTLHTYQAMAEAVFLRRHLVLIKVRRELSSRGWLWGPNFSQVMSGAQ